MNVKTKIRKREKGGGRGGESKQEKRKEETKNVVESVRVFNNPVIRAGLLNVPQSEPRRSFAGAPSFHRAPGLPQEAPQPPDQAPPSSSRAQHCRWPAPPRTALCPQSHSCVRQVLPIHRSPAHMCLPWKQVPVGKAWAGQGGPAEVSAPRRLKHAVQAATCPPPRQTRSLQSSA